jgi:hypothetical protein
VEAERDGIVLVARLKPSLAGVLCGAEAPLFHGTLQVRDADYGPVMVDAHSGFLTGLCPVRNAKFS